MQPDDELRNDSLSERSIWAVNVNKRTALTNRDEVCTITNLYDSAGDETNDSDKAVTAVARLRDDVWFSIDLTQFDIAATN